MAYHDAFILQHSDLNPFLFAEVGTERNGMSSLTVVSVIARLGEDPWKEARRMSTLPKTAATDYLARIIARMPASPWALTDATAIATRLVSLLPTAPRMSQPGSNWLKSWQSVPQWARLALLYGVLGAGLVMSVIAFHGPTGGTKDTSEQAGTHQAR